MKTILSNIAYCIVCIFSLYIVFCWITFQANNPTANDVQFFVHFKEVITFQTLMQFQ